MLQSIRDFNVRLNYASRRRPVAWSILTFAVLVFVLLPYSHNLFWGVVFPLVVSVTSFVMARSAWGKERFARWAASHPYPSRHRADPTDR